MSKQDWDDDKLISFLRENRPAPPPGMLDHENKLVKCLNKPGQPGKTKPWAIPSTLAACALLFWTGYKFQSPSLKAVSAEDLSEVDSFVVSTWDGINQTVLDAYVYTPESQLSLSKPLR